LLSGICNIFAIVHRNKVRTLIEVVIHALFWLGVYYALQALTVYSYRVMTTNNGRVANVDGRMPFHYSWVTVGALMGLFYGNILWLFRGVLRFRNRLLAVSVVAGWLFVMFALNYELVLRMISRGRNPADRSDAGGAALHGPPPPSRPTLFSVDDWKHMQLVMCALFLAILSIAVAYFFIKEWIRNELQRSQAEAQKLSAEVKFLRSQINPHFLFNTLNNLYSIAQRGGDEKLADGISRLSGMMRYMTYEINTDTVPLLREIGYLEDCIAINKLRYADSEVSVNFSYPAPQAIARVQVAPMLFISFLENAFKHGVSIGHHSCITMAISIDPKKLVFTCENPDHSAVRRLKAGEGGVGLENVRRRLELVYPGRYNLQAGPEEGKYKVNLQIEFA